MGKIRTLIYHFGKTPRGDRTDWVMHEYRLEDKVLAQKNVPQVMSFGQKSSFFNTDFLQVLLNMLFCSAG